ncbi:hypothetical protein J4N45_10630 [Vibrio sp. SCSIO 43140]|uniref:hypothetical protein n=1 Tax=Vibrio sp. SCSIO 43140 TaxID=2819100 RepID=UPI00207543AD|nr:hypothetical protein [Vibrio sp. SCSIO 43140]USD58986.1 hypothetical protein J4N45_10630 [Vibrio sp. SCSIO 43140]
MSKTKVWAVYAQRRNRDLASQGDGQPKFLNVLQREFGFHESRDDAVRALVVVYYPELATSNIQHIRRVSKEFLHGNMSHYKIATYTG